MIESVPGESAGATVSVVISVTVEALGGGGSWLFSNANVGNGSNPSLTVLDSPVPIVSVRADLFIDLIAPAVELLPAADTAIVVVVRIIGHATSTWSCWHGVTGGPHDLLLGGVSLHVHLLHGGHLSVVGTSESGGSREGEDCGKFHL